MQCDCAALDIKNDYMKVAPPSVVKSSPPGLSKYSKMIPWIQSKLNHPDFSNIIKPDKLPQLRLILCLPFANASLRATRGSSSNHKENNLQHKFHIEPIVIYFLFKEGQKAIASISVISTSIGIQVSRVNYFNFFIVVFSVT